MPPYSSALRRFGYAHRRRGGRGFVRRLRHRRAYALSRTDFHLRGPAGTMVNHPHRHRRQQQYRQLLGTSVWVRDDLFGCLPRPLPQRPGRRHRRRRHLRRCGNLPIDFNLGRKTSTGTGWATPDTEGCINTVVSKYQCLRQWAGANSR